MAFDQRSGPPASTKQMAYLRSLLKAAGHDDFRTARREFGLTQRQSGGKFTSKEASALIDRLLGNEPAEPEPEPELAAPATSSRTAVASGVSDEDGRWADLVRGIPADVLAGELERRGWSVTPPV
jgi:hypothetical protein